ncbi:prepilin-type N-terminal cleavage/methylation domain-containing protein [Paraglaciecola aquimarina]|uniref:Prepilin-type N-terminal cleavage/methylation domain-containing protein n=1 Tax=Paraglaciecola aquimarina TaxID=1235557 RepID=A0ABU3SSJ3_9ALTE|nr:prepilin-type N-terminal cleavage/methylation domain-containing protein [Paraglaciecola aquimarina]MDU0352991.1 prepilin-type N-terminal cleavage/methylation domain-containing protein [Paraglaciecola aquimarina]
MNKAKLPRGFTLIELIIVIVILGILAVVAAPKFIDLQGDAIAAQMSSIQGTLKSANTFTYAKATLSNQQSLSSGSISIGNATVSTTVGYLTADAANVVKALQGSYEIMVGAADTITADWGVFDLPGGDAIYIVPKGYATFENCNVYYNVDASNLTEPVFYRLTTSGC